MLNFNGNNIGFTKFCQENVKKKSNGKFCYSLVSLMFKQMFSNGWVTVLHICYDGFETLAMI
jgi:hypothetical protein